MDLSRRPSLVALEAQAGPAVSSETKDQNSTGLARKPAEGVESAEGMEGDENEEPDEKEEKKPADLPVKMEVEESSSTEQSMVFLLSLWVLSLVYTSSLSSLHPDVNVHIEMFFCL